MRITEVELRRIRLPLVTPFTTGHGSQAVRDTLLVKVTTADAQGWGECVALSEPGYTSEYVEGAHHVMTSFLVPALLDQPRVTAEGVGPALAWVKGHHMAKAAIEMAVLDAELRARDEPLAQHLGGVRKVVDAGVAVGIAASVGELLDEVDGYVEAGYRRVKLKIAPSWDLEPVRAVRERFPDTPLQVDANAAYTLADAQHLARLDQFDLLLIEQPLPEDDLAGHAALAQRISTPVCLDESITSTSDAAEAIAQGACSVVNIKPGRVGGYLEARRIHDVCADHGVAVWCGGMLETGIGRGANLALAALPGFTLPGDLSASDRYFHRDVTEPFVLHDGRLRVPTGPGIGVVPLPDALDEVTVSIEHLHPQ